MVKEKKYYENTIPDFIPEKAHIQKSNKELLLSKNKETTIDNDSDNNSNDKDDDDASEMVENIPKKQEKKISIK